MDLTRKTRELEQVRPQLLGIAYRMLGSIADAEDAVQDTGVRWLAHDGAPPDNPAAWLTRVCTNRCLDILKSSTRSRTDYVGPWLPEQLLTAAADNAEEQLAVASSLTTAFLLLLERLTPKERAAYLLHDIFAKPFDEVAAVLGLQPANCRQLAARGRSFVAQNRVRHIPDPQRQHDLLQVFKAALQTGDTDALGAMLSADADLRADSGGKVAAIHHVLVGPGEICGFVAGILSKAWAKAAITPRVFNGSLGLVVEDPGRIQAAISFAFDPDGSVRHIFIMRHPDKLGRMMTTVGQADATGALTLQ